MVANDLPALTEAFMEPGVVVPDPVKLSQLDCFTIFPEE